MRFQSLKFAKMRLRPEFRLRPSVILFLVNTENAMLIIIPSLFHFMRSERSSVTKLVVRRVGFPDPCGELTTLRPALILGFRASGISFSLFRT